MATYCCNASVTLDDNGLPICKSCYEYVTTNELARDQGRYEVILIHQGTDSAVFIADPLEDEEWTMTLADAKEAARKGPGRWFDHSDVTYREFLDAGGDDPEPEDQAMFSASLDALIAQHTPAAPPVNEGGAA